MTKESIEEIFTEVGNTLLKKNADYGGASFDLGTNGNMVHLWDKVRRYRSLTEKGMKGETPNFESMEDTLKDIIGYAVIGLHILESEERKIGYSTIGLHILESKEQKIGDGKENS